MTKESDEVSLNNKELLELSVKLLSGNIHVCDSSDYMKRENLRRLYVMKSVIRKFIKNETYDD